MAALKDPEAKRPLSRAKLVSRPDEVFAKRASRPLRSAWTAPVPGESDAGLLAMPESKESGRPTANPLIAMPEITSWNLSAPSAPARLPVAVTGQPEMATEGADPAACGAAATSKPAAVSATWRGVQ